jgi:hypothetical protein
MGDQRRSKSMKTQGEHIRTLRRRVDFLKARDYRNSYDAAELSALEWALVNLPPQASKPWVGLTDDEVSKLIDTEIGFNSCSGWETEYTRAVEAKLKAKNAQA